VRRPDSDPTTQASASNYPVALSEEVFSKLPGMPGRQTDSTRSHTRSKFREQVSPSLDSEYTGGGVPTGYKPTGEQTKGTGSKVTRFENIATQSKQAGSQGSRPLMSGQGSQIPSKGPSPRTGGSKEVPPIPAVLRSPKSVQGKGTVSLASTSIAATGDVNFRNQMGPATNEDLGTLSSGKDKTRIPLQDEQRSLFSKRPIQPAMSSSALFGSSSQDRSEPLSRSKSQLTFLLEKDRAKAKEQKETSDATTSKPKDAGQGK
jgi:hypothetical protein